MPKKPLFEPALRRQPPCYAHRGLLRAKVDLLSSTGRRSGCQRRSKIHCNLVRNIRLLLERQARVQLLAHYLQFSNTCGRQSSQQNVVCTSANRCVKKFNKNGTYLLTAMFSKHETMIVALMSLSSTLRLLFYSCLLRSSSPTHTVGFRYLSVITGVARKQNRAVGMGTRMADHDHS